MPSIVGFFKRKSGSKKAPKQQVQQQQQQQQQQQDIQTEFAVFDTKIKLLAGLVCMLCLAIFFLVYLINFGMAQQQHKLEQLKEEQQQNLKEVEEKLAETSGNNTSTTADQLTLTVVLLLLILVLFHIFGFFKGRIDGMEVERVEQPVVVQEPAEEVVERKQGDSFSLELFGGIRASANLGADGPTGRVVEAVAAAPVGMAGAIGKVVQAAIARN